MRQAVLLKTAVLFLGTAVFLSDGAPSPATGGIPGEASGWIELPNTRLRDVCPPNTPRYPFKEACHAVINTWSGGAFDTLRNRLLIWGGGHGNYYGNEVYALDLNASRFLRLTDPSPGFVPGGPCARTLPDGNPAGRHTYGGLAYIAHADRLFAFGGSLACGPGDMATDTWTFDLKTLKWRDMRPTGTPPANTIVVSIYDPASRLVFANDGYRLYAYNHDANRWQRLGREHRIPGLAYMSVVLDSARKRLVYVGGETTSRIYTISLDADRDYAPRAVPTTGATAITRSASPGLAYDPIRDRLVAWDGSRTRVTPETVYSLIPVTNEWEAFTFAGGPRGFVPGSFGLYETWGTFGRWQYVPKLDAFVVVNSVDENAFLFRLPNSSTGNRRHSRPEPPAGSGSPNPARAPVTAVPLRQWIALEVPDLGKGVQYGRSVYEPMKHVSAAVNPLNGRIYFTGGDYGVGRDLGQSYVQATFSLSLAERLANRSDRNAGWRVEYPYCGPPGQVQPKHPDHVGWTWDAKRRLFWMVPGIMEVSVGGSNCPGESEARSSDPGFVFNHLMTFDPGARRWTAQSANINGTSNWSAHYDPATDTITKFRWDGTFGQIAAVYDIASDKWTEHRLGKNATGADVRFSTISAIDREQRVIYSIDGEASGRLYRYRMDDHRVDDLGVVPGGATRFWECYIAWDSVSRVLFYYDYGRRGFHVYDPEEGTWKKSLPTETDIPGVRAQGRLLVFDAYQNLMLLMGGSDPDLTPHMYVYRYGDGKQARGVGRPRGSSIK